MARKPLPRAVQRRLDKLEPELRRAFMNAIKDATSKTDMASLVRALDQGDLEQVLLALGVQPAMLAPFDDAMRSAYVQGGRDAVAQLPTVKSRAGTVVRVGFNGRHPRAETWANAHSGRLIVEIVAEQRDLIRGVLERGLAAGVNPTTTALEIVGRIDRATGRRVGGLIGLTSQQAEFVQNARAQLENLDPAYFERKLRDRRFDRSVQRAIAAEKPLTAAEIDQIAGRYSDRLLKLRGDTIARTETITALRAGKSEAFQQLVDDGHVKRTQITRIWRATGDDRTREDHIAMDGVEVEGVDTPFTLPDGSRLMFPGDTSLGAPGAQTINCRCYEDTRIDFLAGVA